jgi:uncharacterized protein (TIGR02996 family)
VPTCHDDVFLQDVLAQPDDDIPRLIYADWLEDHGDADRAEFIRVQCRLARTRRDCPALTKLRRREHFLLGRFGPTWRRALPAWLRSGVVFRRGFIDEFAGFAGTFFRDDPEDYFRAAPTTTILHLTGLNATQLARLPHLSGFRRLRELELQKPKEVNGAWFIDCVPHEASEVPRTLRLTSCYLLDAGLEKLVCKPWLKRVEHLGLAENHLTDFSVDLMLEAPAVRGLRSLDVGRNLFGSEGLARLRALFGARLHVAPED